MSSISQSTRLLLSLSMLRGVGPAALKRVSALPRLCEQSIEQLSAVVPQIQRALVTEAAWLKAQEEAESQIELSTRNGIRILSALDAEYPALLASTKDDPFLLHVKGSLAPSPGLSVAIIGTREPTPHGQMIARRVTEYFAEKRWSVVSGLAIGCDSIAHQSALDAGAHTVAVLAHGLHMIAPSRHKKLSEDILTAGGALVSEYPYGQGVQNQQYVKRDKTQAGMAQGVIMIQSDIKGGSLHASRAALSYGRWLAVPYPTDKDRERQEPKVQANLLIADGSDSDRIALLHCSASSLQLVKIVRGREDYLRLIEATVDPKLTEVSSSLGIDGDIAAIAPHRNGAVANAFVETPVELFNPLVVSEQAFSMQRGPIQPHVPNSRQDLHFHVAELSETSLQPAPRYNLSQTLGDYEALNIVQISPVPRGPETQAMTVEVVVAARLRHLQERLRDFKKHHGSVKRNRHAEDDVSRWLSIEDVLTQMKRAAESLDAIHHNLSAAEFASGGSTPASQTDTVQLTLLGDMEVKRPLELPLIEVLSDVIESLPQSQLPSPSGRTSSVPSGEREVEVTLRELVRSFNELIRGMLDPNTQSVVEKPDSPVQ